ncbi:hypothetical protein Hanom_Chr15g01360071 [Helianthus anomalus]
MPFLRFDHFCDFHLKLCFSAFGSKRFKSLPLSSDSLTPSTFNIKSGVFSFFYLFVNVYKKSNN